MQFDFYQYFLRVQDADVERLLKSFTLLDLSEIEDAMNKQRRAPEDRIAQRLLASTLTSMIHGPEGLASAKKSTELLFGGQGASRWAASDVVRMAGDAPVCRLPMEDVVGASLVSVVARIGLTSSKGNDYNNFDFELCAHCVPY